MQSDSFSFCISFVCSLHGLAKMKALHLSCKPLTPRYSLPQTINIQSAKYLVTELTVHHNVHKCKWPKPWDPLATVFPPMPLFSIWVSQLHTCCMPCLLHSSFDHLNNIMWQMQIIGLLIAVFSSYLFLISIQPNHKLWAYGNKSPILHA